MASSVIKPNREVDQTSGNSVQIQYGSVALSSSGGDFSRAFVPFPFYAKNTDYTVTLATSTISISNVGSTNVTVRAKYHNGVVLNFDKAARGEVIFDSSDSVMTITFA